MHHALQVHSTLTVLSYPQPAVLKCRMPWQRVLSLQVLRWLMSDPLLLYALFTSYDMSIHHDVNAVHDTLHVALDIVKVRHSFMY